MEGWKSNWRPITEEIAKTGLEILLDTTQHPVIVMCATGIHETGILIGCLRKLIGWNFNAIIFEYRSFAGNKSRMANEQFIELFDIDLVSISLLKVPKWYTTYLAIDT
jgi:protein tyrosine/serine phosphatase